MKNVCFHWLRDVCCPIAAFVMIGASSVGLVANDTNDLPSSIALSDGQWKQLDNAVDRGLEFLSKMQMPDGSYESQDRAQSAVTSFCVMAYLSCGHVPGEGPYGEQLNSAIDFVLTTQQPNGLFCPLTPGTEEWKLVGSYNHAITGLMLGEVYGMTDSSRQSDLRRAIEKALEFTHREQDEPKRNADDRGGWRYLLPSSVTDSDLSVTSWHLMFYRSARNAEFDVPKESIDAAVSFIERCYDSQRGTFCYGLRGRGRSFYSRSMAGAGIVSLSLAGKHDSEMAQTTSRFVLRHPFTDFNRGGLTMEDRYYYGAYYCSQAMFQLGGEHFTRFYPGLLQTLVDNQNRNGSWPPEANQDGPLGPTYSTSLAILALTPPYQLLPIYQR
ncbi:MAG: terpene cyclase/mutase family protein [Planctomycetaceae bacterium]|nr:terpene cyclase/mutase family protein [Planctomycetaceae bacterium]